MRIRNVVGILALFSLSGCYHAVIETGLAPSQETIVQPWANSFIYGLVPPPVVQTMERCRNGVAKVETQHSFLNALVGGITWGIYTPMTIMVTCSTGQRAATDGAPMIPVGEDAEAAMRAAVEMARETGKAAYLQF